MDVLKYCQRSQLPQQLFQNIRCSCCQIDVQQCCQRILVLHQSIQTGLYRIEAVSICMEDTVETCGCN